MFPLFELIRFNTSVHVIRLPGTVVDSFSCDEHEFKVGH